MTILFAGNQFTDFLMPNTNAVETTTAGWFDSAWVPNAMSISNYSNPPLLSPVFAAQTNAWVHFEVRPGTVDTSAGGNTTTALWFRGYDSSGVERFRLHTGAGAAVIASYYNGTSWTVIGTSGTGLYVQNVRYQFDINIDIPNNKIDFYIGRTLAYSFSGTLGSNLAQIGLNSFDNGNQAGFSQVIVADESTLWFKYKLDLPNANSSTNTAFTGDYTAVDEAILSDLDYITSGTANQVETFKAPARTFTGYSVLAVILNYRALRDTTGPQNIRGVLTIGGTNYETSDRALGLGFTNFKEYYSTNPATGIAWTPAAAGDVNLEFGVKSIT